MKIHAGLSKSPPVHNLYWASSVEVWMGVVLNVLESACRRA
jgi:hypothetical protein